MLAKFKSSIIHTVTRQLIIRYKEDHLAPMSAQITYYLILAFFPFLFFLMNVLSFTSLPNRLLIANFTAFLPNDTALVVKNIIGQTVQAKSTALLLFGMLGSIWAASQGVFAVIRGLNHAYGVQESRSFMRLLGIAILSTLGFSIMIIVSFFMIVFGRTIGSYAFDLLGEKALFYSIWPWIRYGISFAVMFVTFYLIYNYLPNRKLKFRHLIIGTAFTTFGWVAASLLFSFYVNNFAIYEKVYGSLGGVFALIVWLNISTLIFLFGGELIAMSSKYRNDDGL